jgi:hypothetical protein
MNGSDSVQGALREALDTSPKKIRGYARAGANFENIRTNVETVTTEIYCISPISRTAEPAVSKGSWERLLSAQNCVMLNVFPSGSLNHATLAPLGEFQIPS